MSPRAVPDLTVVRLQKAIRETAVEKLGRALRPAELRFVNAREGLVALEMILDTVRSAGPEEIETFLNSDRA